MHMETEASLYYQTTETDHIFVVEINSPEGMFHY